jgi:ribosomal protein S18 acetylase RimI-like enzyme
MHFQDSIYFKDHYRNFTFESRCEDFSELTDEDIKITVINNSGSIVGYCVSSIKKGIGEIDSVYIDAEYRNEGYGKKLIEISLNWLKESNCRKIMVAVANGNEKAFGFYMKMGFYPRLTYLHFKNN